MNLVHSFPVSSGLIIKVATLLVFLNCSILQQCSYNCNLFVFVDAQSILKKVKKSSNNNNNNEATNTNGRIQMKRPSMTIKNNNIDIAKRPTKQKNRPPGVLNSPNNNNANKNKNKDTAPTPSPTTTPTLTKSDNDNDTIPLAKQKCRICNESIRVPNPRLILLDKKCSEWNKQEYFIPTTTSTSNNNNADDIAATTCTNIQATIGAACQCPNPPKPKCNVCDNVNDYVWNNAPQYNTFTDDYCVKMIFKMSQRYEFCIGNKDHVAKMCCNNTCKVDEKDNKNSGGNTNSPNVGKNYNSKKKGYNYKKKKYYNKPSGNNDKKSTDYQYSPNKRPSDNSNPNNNKPSKPYPTYPPTNDDYDSSPGNNNNNNNDDVVYYYYYYNPTPSPTPNNFINDYYEYYYYDDYYHDDTI